MLTRGGRITTIVWPPGDCIVGSSGTARVPTLGEGHVSTAAIRARVKKDFDSHSKI